MNKAGVALLMAALTGCGTPTQSRTQVVDAARDLVSTTRIVVVEAFFWRAPCGPDGGAPFRGQMRIGYPRAADSASADAELATMIARLVAAGWSGDPKFRSHGAVLAKDGVHALLRPQNAGVATRNIELIGQCRDLTTTSDQAGRVEAIHLMDT